MQQDGCGSVTGRSRRPVTDQLTSAKAEKVHKEKAQQDKLKEVKARLNFEGCSRKNSKIQEVSQHSESRTPDVGGDLRRRLRSRRSHSTSRSHEPNPNVFSRIRCDRSESPRNRLGDKGRKEGGVFKRLGVKKEVCSYIQRAAIKVPVQEERNQSLESVPRRNVFTENEKLSESEGSGGGHLSHPDNGGNSRMQHNDQS
nr:hypothetical protein [Tanacetum cinerariifolium]